MNIDSGLYESATYEDTNNTGGGGLFGSDSSDEVKKKPKQSNLFDDESDEIDSDVDRPPLSEADRRRRENKMRSKKK